MNSEDLSQYCSFSQSLYEKHEIKDDWEVDTSLVFLLPPTLPNTACGLSSSSVVTFYHLISFLNRYSMLSVSQSYKTDYLDSQSLSVLRHTAEQL